MPREDFQQMPSEARSRLLDMLCQSGVESRQWWWDVLVGDGNPLYRELEPLRQGDEDGPRGDVAQRGRPSVS